MDFLEWLKFDRILSRLIKWSTLLRVCSAAVAAVSDGSALARSFSQSFCLIETSAWMTATCTQQPQWTKSQKVCVVNGVIRCATFSCGTKTSVWCLTFCASTSAASLLLLTLSVCSPIFVIRASIFCFLKVSSASWDANLAFRSSTWNREKKYCTYSDAINV